MAVPRFIADSAGGITDLFKRFGKASPAAGASAGRATAAITAGGARASSGRMASAMHGIRGTGGKMLSYSSKHPFKAAGMGAMGLGGVSYLSGRTRRGPGTSKVSGRPTGMYKY